MRLPQSITHRRGRSAALRKCSGRIPGHPGISSCAAAPLTQGRSRRDAPAEGHRLRAADPALALPGRCAEGRPSRPAPSPLGRGLGRGFSCHAQAARQRHPHPASGHLLPEEERIAFCPAPSPSGRATEHPSVPCRGWFSAGQALACRAAAGWQAKACPTGPSHATPIRRTLYGEGSSRPTDRQEPSSGLRPASPGERWDCLLPRPSGRSRRTSPCPIRRGAARPGFPSGAAARRRRWGWR